MDIFLLAFANNREKPLDTLTDEYAALNKSLSPRVLRQHFLSWAISHATLDDIAYYLTLFRERLRLFQFSGHAGRDVLLTEEGKSRASGIAHLLGQCPNLKVVILNGCSTQGQVKLLHEQGIPLVIATSAPVEDTIATRFSQRLYQALETGQSIADAFEMACGETLAQKEIQIYRDEIGLLKNEEPKGPVWGIFSHPDHPEAKNWKFPTKPTAAANPYYEPNELLLETLYDTFASTNHHVAYWVENGATLEMQKEAIVGALLKALPAPISEQIRKLIMPSLPGATDGWDKVGMMRLSQIAQAYQISMDFLVFTLLAQLWEMSMVSEWKPTKALALSIQAFLHLPASERQDYDYFSFIRTLRDAFSENSPSLFVREFEQLRTHFLEDEKVKNACFFLETLRRQLKVIGTLEMAELCERGEIALADLFSKLGFLGQYIMATIRNIDVQKYRHTTEAQFEHLVMKWHGAIGIYEKEFRRQSRFMDNRSVILLRWGDQPEDNGFLNLSPFILDENTFERVPDLSLSKLYFFAQLQGDRLYYKCVNDPDEDIIDLDAEEFYLRKKKGAKFQLAKDQFEAFYHQIVQG